MVPRPLYAFDRDGSPQTELNRATWPEQQLYIDQRVATNRLILETINKILASSPVKPIFILQADEGSYLMSGDQSLSDSEQKRTGILSAILIPDEAIRERAPKRLMPVNISFLIREYFGAPIAQLPDGAIYWETSESTGAAAPDLRIIEVTTQSPPDRNGARADGAPDA